VCVYAEYKGQTTAFGMIASGFRAHTLSPDSNLSYLEEAQKVN
jgi:hypothetical protein